MKIIKRIMATFVAVILVLDLMTMPVLASSIVTGNYVQVSIESQQYSSSYTAYDSEKKANENHIVLYMDEADFPVTAKIVGKNGHTESYVFDSYGTKRLEVADPDDIGYSIAVASTFFLALPILMAAEPHRYAFIDIKPASEKINVSSIISVPSEKQSNESFLSLTIDEKWQILLEEIHFPCTRAENTPYARELKAFLAGEWDGTCREGDDWSNYVSIRYISGRMYYWIATDLSNGNTYQLSANVDYKGYKEVIPGSATNQEYSLAASRVNGEIEMWSLFELQDAWKIESVASGEEYLVDIIPLASNISGDDDCMVYVSTLDADGVQHMYQLLRGGKINKTI